MFKPVSDHLCTYREVFIFGDTDCVSLVRDSVILIISDSVSLVSSHPYPVSVTSIKEQEQVNVNSWKWNKWIFQWLLCDFRTETLNCSMKWVETEETSSKSWRISWLLQSLGTLPSPEIQFCQIQDFLRFVVKYFLF